MESEQFDNCNGCRNRWRCEDAKRCLEGKIIPVQYRRREIGPGFRRDRVRPIAR